MKNISLQAPVAGQMAATRQTTVAETLKSLMWRVRLYHRWLTITTLAAPNPIMRKGGAI